MSGPLIIVSGLSRCGTSLVMQMLQAGGVAVTGEYPAFELVEFTGPRELSFLQKFKGHGVKIIDPHLFDWRGVPELKVIWLDRDPAEQAKSQIKFGAAVAGLPIQQTRAMVRQWTRALRRDRPRCLALFKALGCETLFLSFERLVEAPLSAARELAEFTGAAPAEAMAEAVRPRGPECYPGLLEIELLEGTA